MCSAEHTGTPHRLTFEPLRRDWCPGGSGAGRRRAGATDPLTPRRAAEVLHAWIVRDDLDRRVADGETGCHVIARMVRVRVRR